MLRAKRPRSMHSSHNGGQPHGHNHRTRSMSEDNLGDDHLMHMDPSLMTERQQLAFLLRTTAQEQSGGDSPTALSGSSDEDTAPRASKRPKKRIQNVKISPVNAPKIGGTSANSGNNKTLACSRSRAVKNSPKHGVAVDGVLSPRSQRAARTTAKHLHVKTSTPTASDSEEVGSVTDKMDANKPILKPSPSSTSDIAHISVFDDHDGQGDFWSLHCALCSQSPTLFDTACEPLFLCHSCDKKYPTQRALGRL